MRKRIVMVVATAVLAGVGASTASAGPRGAFLCYSKWQTDPGYWRFKPSGPRSIVAGDLFAQGYWSPYAEKSIPTHTMLPGGWYLLCNLGQPAIAPTGMQVVGNEFLDSQGRVWTPSNPYFYPAVLPNGTAKAGYYPLAAAQSL